MKSLLIFLTLFIFIGCSNEKSTESKYTSTSQVKEGKAQRVMLTTYSTTLIANGTDHTNLRIALTDSLGREIISANDTVHLYVIGDGKVIAQTGADFKTATDTSGSSYSIVVLQGGVGKARFITGNTPNKVKVEARSGELWPGSHEIHTLPSTFNSLVPTQEQILPTTKSIDKMIGADISFLPQIEARGGKFYENGTEIDAIQLLKKHGFNYIRLRVFVNPENPKGYSPEQGFCGLDYTLSMAKRIEDSGMKLLLDFHYSDYWADPQQQNKPLSWENLDAVGVQDSLRSYTSMVLMKLSQQGTPPAMVQIGNEINHGMVWPDGHIGNPDGLASLLRAGVEGVESVDPTIPIMMHIALGGQNDESVFWLDNMIARGVRFDIIGLSYYPRWHGTLQDLESNLNDLIIRYNKPLNVVEYSDFKREVHEIVFNLPDEFGKGTAIWEPLGRRSRMFNEKGEVNELISVYDEMNKKYLQSQH